VIASVLDEFTIMPALAQEFDSEDVVMDYPDTVEFLKANGVLDD
jgi:hypothetical protein